MALKPNMFVTAINVAVDPDNNPQIFAGQFVALDSDGFAIRHTGSNAVRTIGVAGDSTVPSTSSNKANPYTGQVTIGSSGQQVFTENRLTDPNSNETAASGKITVYNGGGDFETDQFETVVSAAPAVYVPGAALYISTDGKLTTDSTSGTVVATVLEAPRPLSSGVPGVETSDNSISLGNFMRIKLEV